MYKKFFEKDNFINHVQNSRKKLKNCTIEGILFHELNPFSLNINFLEDLNIYLNKLNITKLGYAGKFIKELPDINIPNCIKILQLEIPIGLNEIDEKDFIDLLSYGSPRDEYDIESAEITSYIIKILNKRKRKNMKIYLNIYKINDLILNIFINWFVKDEFGYIDTNCSSYKKILSNRNNFYSASENICYLINSYNE